MTMQPNQDPPADTDSSDDEVLEDEEAELDLASDSVEEEWEEAAEEEETAPEEEPKECDIKFEEADQSAQASSEPEPASAESTDKTDEVEWAKPLGSGEYEVKQGDCLSSISEASGHVWKTIWNDPANKSVAEKRKSPNLLLPGDRLHIPDLRKKEKGAETEKRHRFTRKAVPDKLRLRFLDEGKPRASQPYKVSFDVGAERTGTLDGDGKLDISLPAGAQKATVRIGKDDAVEYEFSLGAIDPIDSVSGVQQRLANLGYSPGDVDGVLGPETRSAIAEFQADQEGLESTGYMDKKTLAKLQDLHDKRSA